MLIGAYTKSYAKAKVYHKLLYLMQKKNIAYGFKNNEEPFDFERGHGSVEDLIHE